MIGAAILAAGFCGPEFQEAVGVTHKCLIPVAGRTMVARVLESVRESHLVDRIVVVGPAELLRSAGVDAEIVPNEGDSYVESVLRGVEALGTGQLLLIAADVPLLRGDQLEAWLSRCLAMRADLCIPVVSRQAMNEALPGARKTWYHLSDGEFTKGNAAVADSGFFLDRLDRISNLFHTRKEKKWTGLVCEAFVQRVLSCTASLADMEAGLSSYLGARVRSVSCPPELAVDVDEVGDVAFVETALLERGRRQPCCV